MAASWLWPATRHTTTCRPPAYTAAQRFNDRQRTAKSFSPTCTTPERTVMLHSYLLYCHCTPVIRWQILWLSTAFQQNNLCCSSVFFSSFHHYMPEVCGDHYQLWLEPQHHPQTPSVRLLPPSFHISIQSEKQMMNIRETAGSSSKYVDIPVYRYNKQDKTLIIISQF